MKTPLLGRIVIIGAMALLLLLPIALIQGKIAQRRALAEGVIVLFAQETSGPQSVAGPLLALTCEETYAEEREVMRSGKAETVSETRTRACPTGYFAPRTLKVSGHVPVESRYRGIYQIRLYRASLQLAGEFEWPREAAWNGIDTRAWKRAYLVTAVRDARGIKHVRRSRSSSCC